MHIHAHTVSDLSPFCVQFTASQWKPKSGESFFWGGSFYLPQKTSTGPPWGTFGQRHVSGLRFSPLTMQRPLCHSVPFSWSHAWRSKWKNGEGFQGTARLESPGFFVGEISKNLQLVPGKKKKQKSIYVSFATLLTGYLKIYVYIIHNIFI